MERAIDKTSTQKLDQIQELRRSAQFDEAMKLISSSLQEDGEQPELRFEADRIYFELGLFERLGSDVERAGEPADVWHRALRCWALTKQDIYCQGIPRNIDGPGSETEEEEVANRWFKFIQAASSIRQSYLGSAESDEFHGLLEGAELSVDEPEVLIAAARLGAAVVGTDPCEDRRKAAYEKVEAIYKRLDSDVRYGSVLSQVPVSVDATFYWARANYFYGNSEECYKLIAELLGQLEGHQRHMAAHILKARLDRFTGKNDAVCGATIETAQMQLRKLSSAALEPNPDSIEVTAEDVTVTPDGVAPQTDLAVRVELKRMAAVTKIPRDPSGAIADLNEADSLLEAGSALKLRSLNESSQTLPRLYMVTGDPQAATNAALDLLEECEGGLQQVSKAARQAGGGQVWQAAQQKFEAISRDGPKDGELDSPAAKRAVLRVADVMRSQGDVSTAIEWIETARLLWPRSRSTLAKHISLLTNAGRQPEALALCNRVVDPSVPPESNPTEPIEVPESRPGRINDVLTLERARCFLANGRLLQADRLYTNLCLQKSAGSRISGYAGRIDVARRQRDLKTASKLADEARRPGVGELAGHLQAEIATALAWAELQLGRPTKALKECELAIEESPYELAPWLATLRCLRLLGWHSAAISLAKALLFGEDASDVRQIPVDLPSPPNLSTLHSAVLRSELGWCHLDLDHTDQAIAIFDDILLTSGFYATAARGSIAARRNLATPSILAVARQRLEDFHHPVRVGGIRDVNLETARVLLARGEVDAASGFVDAVEADIHSRTPPPSPDAQIRVLFALADAHLDAGDSNRAAEYIARLGRQIDSKTDDRVVMLEVRSLLINRDPRGARMKLDQLRQAGVDSEATLLARVICEFELRDFEEALRQLDEADSREHDNFPKLRRSDVRTEIRVWTLLAQSESPQINEAESKERLEKARAGTSSLDRSSVGEMHLQAILLGREFRSGGKEGPHSIAPAISIMAEARRLRPRDPALMRDHAALLLEKGDERGANRLLHVAADIDPDDARIQLLAGVAHFRRGDVTEAKLHFGRATNLDRFDYVHYRALAKVCLLSGDLDGAQSAVTRGKSRCHASGFFALELLNFEIRWKRIIETKSPIERKSLLNSLDRQMQNVADRLGEFAKLELEQQAVEVQNDYWVLAASVARQLGKKDVAQTRTEKISEGDPRRIRLQSHLDRRRGLSTQLWIQVVLASVGVLLLAAQLLPLAVWMAGQRNLAQVPDLEPMGLAVAVLAVVLAAALPRVGGISMKEIGVDLLPTEPVSELVHTDLDLSSNRLLLISGFSNHRPDIEVEDHEPQMFEEGWGGF